MDEINEIDQIRQRYSKVTELYRSTSKWIISVFAAIAAVLVAGLQLSNLGKVELPYLTVAGLAFIFALALVLLIIDKTVKVLVPRLVNEKSLREIAAQQEQTGIDFDDIKLLDGCKTLEEFLKDYKTVGDLYEEAIKNEKKDIAKELEPEVVRLKHTWAYVSIVASYAMITKSFKDAILWLFRYAFLAAIAIGVFAWATSQKTTVPVTHPIFQSPPSAASLTLSTQGKRLMKETLGTQCVQQAKISVIVLNIQDGKYEVVTTPSAQCKVSKITIDTNIGTVKSTP